MVTPNNGAALILFLFSGALEERTYSAELPDAYPQSGN